MFAEIQQSQREARCPPSLHTALEDADPASLPCLVLHTPLHAIAEIRIQTTLSALLKLQNETIQTLASDLTVTISYTPTHAYGKACTWASWHSAVDSLPFRCPCLGRFGPVHHVLAWLQGVQREALVDLAIPGLSYGYTTCLSTKVLWRRRASLTLYSMCLDTQVLMLSKDIHVRLWFLSTRRPSQAIILIRPLVRNRRSLRKWRWPPEV